MKRLQQAKKLASDIGKLATNGDFPGGDRSALAGACYFIALDHQEAIIKLADSGVHVAALALVRAQVEAFVRGAWIHHVASDDGIEKIKNGKSFPTQWKMVCQLEKLDLFAAGILSKSHEANWSQLHGLAHPGQSLIAMVLKEGHVVRNCDEKYLSSALNYTGIHALLAAAGIAILENDKKKFAEVLDLMKDWTTT